MSAADVIQRFRWRTPAADQDRARSQEQEAIDDVKAALRLLKSSVTRLVDHRRIHGQVLDTEPLNIDYLLVDGTLKTCQELMRVSVIRIDDKLSFMRLTPISAPFIDACDHFRRPGCGHEACNSHRVNHNGQRHG